MICSTETLRIGRWALPVLVSVLALAASLPASSAATAPGRNGSIAFGVREIKDTEDLGVLVRGKSVFAMDAHGGHRRIVVQDGLDPAFSPDGRTLAISTGPDDSWDASGITLHRADGTRIRRLTRGNDRYPSWSPSGRRLAFARTRVSSDGLLEGSRIYTIGRSGKGQRLLTKTGFDPAWSSRGEIAYEFRSDIVVTDPRGQRTRTLVTRADDPDWSPHGDRLVFDRCRGDHCGLFVIRADGTGLRRVYVTRGDLENPVWSPDGRRIAFVHAGIKSVSARGGQLRTLLPADWLEGDVSMSDVVGLAWQPLPR